HARLLDAHRHQEVAPVDLEVEPDAERQAVDADHVLDHVVGGLFVEETGGELRGAGVVEAQLLDEQLAPLLHRELVETGEAGRAGHGISSRRPGAGARSVSGVSPARARSARSAQVASAPTVKATPRSPPPAPDG